MTEYEFNRLVEAVLQKRADKGQLSRFNAELRARRDRLSDFLDQVFADTLLTTAGALHTKRRRFPFRRLLAAAAALALLLAGLGWAATKFFASAPAPIPAPTPAPVAAPAPTLAPAPLVVPETNTVPVQPKQGEIQAMKTNQTALAAAAAVSLALVQPTVSTASEGDANAPQYYACGEVTPPFIETRCYIIVDLDGQTVNDVPPHGTVYRLF